jgi:hypothetical protein
MIHSAIAETGRNIKATYAGLAEDEFVVGREGLRSIDQFDDVAVLERRDTRDRVAREPLKPWPVLRQEAVVEVRGDTVQAEGRRIALVTAHHEPSGIAPEVHEPIRVAHRRQIFRNRLGDAGQQVLMRHRNDGQRDAGHDRDLGRVHPAGVDHHLGFDSALLGLDGAHPAAIGLDRDDPHALADPSAAASRRFGERQRQPARVKVAVGGDEGRPHHAVLRHQRKAPLRLLWTDELEGQTEARPPTRLALQLLHPLAGRGKPETSDLAPADVNAGLLREPPVERDAVHHHSRQRQAGAKLTDEARRMERRPTGQLGPFQQHDVAPTALDEVIRDAGATDAPADDDDARAFGQRHPAACCSQAS